MIHGGNEGGTAVAANHRIRPLSPAEQAAFDRWLAALTPARPVPGAPVTRNAAIEAFVAVRPAADGDEQQAEAIIDALISALGLPRDAA